MILERWFNADLRDGDILQFRGSRYISDMIRFMTGGDHTHSAMLRIDSLGRADALEIREFVGGRAVPLAEVRHHEAAQLRHQGDSPVMERLLGFLARLPRLARRLWRQPCLTRI